MDQFDYHCCILFNLACIFLLCRHYCKTLSHSLPKLLCSTNWGDRNCVAEIYQLLQSWPSLEPEVRYGNQTHGTLSAALVSLQKKCVNCCRTGILVLNVTLLRHSAVPAWYIGMCLHGFEKRILPDIKKRSSLGKSYSNPYKLNVNDYR